MARTFAEAKRCNGLDKLEPCDWTIESMERANRLAGKHFFDADSGRFFRSRILADVFGGEGGVYFVTSERDSLTAAPRRYTVRRFDPLTGGTETPAEGGGFMAFTTSRKAKICAAYLAKHARAS